MSFKFNIDPEFIKKSISEMHPKLFPEIEEIMNLPSEEIIKIIKKHIHRVYDSSGITGIKNLREEYEAKRNQTERRVSRDLINDDKFHLECCLGYFDMWLDHINHMENSLIKSNLYKVTYKEMEQDLKNKYETEKDDLWEKHKSGKGIADHLREYLMGKYPTAEKYPSESTIRKEWLKLTS